MKANVTIKVRNGDLAKALKRFKKAVEQSGVLSEMRQREWYRKPSEQRRIDAVRSKMRRRKREQSGECVSKGW